MINIFLAGGIAAQESFDLRLLATGKKLLFAPLPIHGRRAGDLRVREARAGRRVDRFLPQRRAMFSLPMRTSRSSSFLSRNLCALAAMLWRVRLRRHAMMKFGVFP